ncbi:hypothetical protein TD95_003263 [Thielaviopsis punctulata]|uniref:Amine oxidase n=1 Tax=Thielaviopsis punctulata TaxID=72032 RepID=A0A0F4Z9R6_9PEZI|nr:hypothetical protein TD95_003263 [Thielaviopsis punctulata]
MLPSLSTSLSAALLLGSLVQDAAARPQPKSTWVHKGPARKKMAHNLKRSIETSMGLKAGTYRRDDTEDFPACKDAAATVVTAPKTNIWSALTESEAVGLVSWMFDRPELNLTVSENATSWDNTIILVETLAPNKSDALAYIDNNSSEPVKYAHAVLNYRATDEPYYQDIMIGPVPVQNGTTWQPLTFPYTKKNEGRVRNLDADADDVLYTEWLYKIGASIQDITLDLWNGTFLGLENDTMDLWGIDPLWQDNGRIIRWDGFWNYPDSGFDSETLLPLGLYVQSDVTGRDPSKWEIKGWLYNNIFYKTTEEFRTAYWSEGFVKNGANVEGEWAITDRLGTPFPQDVYQPPVQVAPAGSRFSLDADAQYVEWMGFSFYMGFSRDVGLTLYDIRYEGKRILYELGLQEAMAHYAGNDPVQSGTSYLDTFYGFGPYAFEMVKGYDCPSYATFLNSSFYVSETTHTHLNSICLFESSTDYPIQRHSSSEYISITKNTQFTARTVSTVGNYDYMFSYTFSMDGSIAVEVRASGYIQSAYYAHNEDYGFKIHDNLSGSMHDHVLNFKADFDIHGRNNSIQLVTAVPATKYYPWSDGPRNTMQTKKTFIDNEDHGRFNWADNAKTQVLVVNEDVPNKYGELGGYRVLPYTGTCHLTIEGSSNLVNAGHWAEYDVQVTRQKDTEPRLAHAYNSQDVFEPPVDFSKFFDGENLRKEDLVVWLNLGMHHIPHTGDLPNTVFTTAHSGVQFMPSNYFLVDQSRRTNNMVRIQYGNGSAAQVIDFGQVAENCTLDYEPATVDLWEYKGDVVVRKFPYDPNNPYYETDHIV